MAAQRLLFLAALLAPVTASPIGDWLSRARRRAEGGNQARAPQFANPFGSVFGNGGGGDSLPASILTDINPGGGFVQLTITASTLPTLTEDPTSPPTGGPPPLSFPVFSSLAPPLSLTLGPDPFISESVTLTVPVSLPTLSLEVPPLEGGVGPTSTVDVSLDLTDVLPIETGGPSAPALSIDLGALPTTIETSLDVSLLPTITSTGLEISWPRKRKANADGNANAVRQATTTPTVCVTVLVVQPEEQAGPTLTEYLATVTSTSFLSCGGCSLSLTTALFGPGQLNDFTATVTAPVSTATAYNCSSAHSK